MSKRNTPCVIGSMERTYRGEHISVTEVYSEAPQWEWYGARDENGRADTCAAAMLEAERSVDRAFFAAKRKASYGPKAAP